MRRIILIATVCLIAVSIAPMGPGPSAQQRTQLGGRPGEFHFILKEQADHNRAEFREMQLRIERMRTDISATAANDATRRRMLADLDSYQLFVSSMEAQLTSPVGQTAGDVEQRLEAQKGQANCGTCHENAGIRVSR
jgi:cytochrome c553